MEILTENKIKQYRARSILYTAFPQYRTKFEDPIYWKDGLGKNVDSHALEEALEMTGENVSNFLKREIPKTLLSCAARDLGFSEAELSELITPEEILSECVGKSYFFDTALSYIAEYAMKKMKNDIQDCMHCRAIDSYALQMGEKSIGSGFTTMGMKVTKSKKSPYLCMVDVPNKKKVENARVNEIVTPRPASNIIKVGLGNNGKMRPETENFAVNVIPTVKRNLKKYKESVMSDTFRDFMHDLNHSAEVLGVDL